MSSRCLVLGSGAREHALAWKLSQDAEVIVAPGNAGIAKAIETRDLDLGDYDAVIDLAEEIEASLVVIGPENPLIDGLADELRAEGIAAFGPGRDAAQLEGSKSLSKQAMRESGVPTAEFETHNNYESALEYTRSRFGKGLQVAVKASGAALGKGVRVCETLQEADEWLRELLIAGSMGDAGQEVVIEDRLIGTEFSLLTIVGDSGYYSLPVAQDYKRLLDGDAGPNTGGMGSYSPVSWVSEEMIRQAEEEVVAPMTSYIKSQGWKFRGCLFSGLLVHEGRPHCLEYNVRFGDPETQSVMHRIGEGFFDLLNAAALGDALPEVEVLDNSVVSVVMASPGYPGDYTKGIEVKPVLPSEGVSFFYAGVKEQDGVLINSGGRVLTVTASAGSIPSARELAYRTVEALSFEGAQFRTDIAL